MTLMSPLCMITGGHDFARRGNALVCTYCGKRVWVVKPR